MIVSLPVASSTFIEPGWPIYLDGIRASPAWDFPWAGSIEATREQFAPLFVGLALDGSDSGQTDPIRIQCQSNEVWPLVTGIIELGVPVGLAENAGVLSNEMWEQVTRPEAIGRITETSPAGQSTGKIQIANAFFAPTINRQAGVSPAIT